jgi:hypothetical protein
MRRLRSAAAAAVPSRCRRGPACQHLPHARHRLRLDGRNLLLLRRLLRQQRALVRRLQRVRGAPR